MCTTTLTLPAATRSTSALMLAACCEICPAIQEKHEAESRPVRINWIVFTDENGNRRPQMRWRADQ
jgi:hypothetical protein